MNRQIGYGCEIEKVCLKRCLRCRRRDRLECEWARRLCLLGVMGDEGSLLQLLRKEEQEGKESKKGSMHTYTLQGFQDPEPYIISDNDKEEAKTLCIIAIRTLRSYRFQK